MLLLPVLTHTGRRPQLSTAADGFSVLSFFLFSIINLLAAGGLAGKGMERWGVGVFLAGGVGLCRGVLGGGGPLAHPFFLELLRIHTPTVHPPLSQPGVDSRTALQFTSLIHLHLRVLAQVPVAGLEYPFLSRFPFTASFVVWFIKHFRLSDKPDPCFSSSSLLCSEASCT